jgi:hypothetical protein
VVEVKNMKKLFTRWKWLGYVESALLIIVGVLAICFNANTNLHAAIGYIVATYLFINALLMIIGSLALDLTLLDGDLIVGIIVLVFSIWLYAEPTIFIDALPLIVGVFTMVFGLVIVGRSVLVITSLGTTPRSIIYLIFGFLLFAVGLSIVTLQYSGTADVSSFIILIFGIILAVEGLALLWDVLYVNHGVHEVKKAIKDDVVDVEVNEKK